MNLDFQDSSLALTADGLAAVTDSLSVGAAEVWTVLAVETKGSGFLPDRRPPILFERHIFSRLTNRAFDIADFSNPQAGGYGAGGAHQYDRLGAAIARNRSAALQSASWGLAQIMGENFTLAGFAGVEEMVSSMCASEDAQLAAFASFLKGSNLTRHLQSHDWTSLARGYNGPNFAVNRYDSKLAEQFAKFSAGPLPDLKLRTAQLYLTYAGLDPGPIDGTMGPKTKAALQAFQTEKGLPQTGLADDETSTALQPAVTD